MRNVHVTHMRNVQNELYAYDFYDARGSYFFISKSVICLWHVHKLLHV